MLDTEQRTGKKRKLYSVNSNLLAKLTWMERKPKHLSVSEGFLPDDTQFKSTAITSSNINNCIDDFCDANQNYLLRNHNKCTHDGKTIHVIDYVDASHKKAKGHHFTKFHSLLQILVRLYDEETKSLVPQRLWLLSSNNLSSTHESIFDLNGSEFTYEYQSMKRSFPFCAIPWIEKGLELLDKETNTVARMSGNRLLRYLFDFLQGHRSLLSRKNLAIASINESFGDLRLHFDCLCLLINAEDEALRADGHARKRKCLSAFDLLQDVWVCYYSKYKESYSLRYVTTEAWENYNNGVELVTSAYSKEVKTFRKKEELEHFATIASKHYEFYGLSFVLPEHSLLYTQFKMSCIKA